MYVDLFLVSIVVHMACTHLLYTSLVHVSAISLITSFPLVHPSQLEIGTVQEIHKVVRYTQSSIRIRLHYTR